MPRPPFLARMLEHAARQVGAHIVLEPEFRYVGYIGFPDGRRSFFRNTNFAINDLGAAEIARDKFYAAHFLDRFGYRVPRHRLLFSDAYRSQIARRKPDSAARMPGRDSAAAIAAELGFPLIVKPNDRSQGQGVELVADHEDLHRALEAGFRLSDRVLLEEYCQGDDFRVVVLDGEAVAAYQRVPFHIVGDGTRSVAALLRGEQEAFRAAGRTVPVPLDDDRMVRRLRRAGLDLDSVPAGGRVLRLLDNANLSSGGDCIDLTGRLHPDFRRLAVAATSDMGLRFCGVDLLAGDPTAAIDRDDPPVILEINAAPGLDNFAALGAEQECIVQDIYTRMLRLLRDNRGSSSP